ncbi:hypothetical protein [Streptomyces macrosporus]
MSLSFPRFRAPRHRPAATVPAARAARAWEDSVDELPDEDLGEDLRDALELYRPGSKPRCEESEYLEIVEDAADRIARGR